MAPRIAIVGSMGAGKSTVAALVANRLGLTLFDSDRWIETETGINARDHAETNGVEALHQLEAEAMDAVLANPPGIVITPAASVADRPDVMRRLRSETVVVWLDVDPDTAIARGSAGAHRRPLDPTAFAALHARRSAAFAAAADLRLNAGRLPHELADAVVEFVTSNG